MTNSSNRIRFVGRSKVARWGAYCFVSSLTIAGIIFKLHPDEAYSPRESLFVASGLVLAVLAATAGAGYALYLAIGAIRSGQFPAPHAHLPTKCKVTVGPWAMVYAAMMMLGALSLGVAAVFLAWWTPGAPVPHTSAL